MPDFFFFTLPLAREQDRYRIVGLVLAWSLVHGGPAGNFLSPTLYNSVAYGPSVIPPRLEDVPVQKLRQKIEQVSLENSNVFPPISIKYRSDYQTTYTSRVITWLKLTTNRIPIK